jgi:hypothetical protein
MNMEIRIAVPTTRNGITIRVEHEVLSGRSIDGTLAMVDGDVSRIGEYGRACLNAEVIAYGEIVRGLLLAGV